MKKIIAVVAIVAVAVIFMGGAGFLFLRGKKSSSFAAPTPKQEESLIETSLEERPYVTLIPSVDGHWLTIDISQIQEASSLEYELLYNTASGAMQGSVNEVDLKGETSYSKKILLGSESSGHYKYDEGVERGTITVRLRGQKGPRKFISDFHLQKGGEQLISADEKFKVKGQLSASAFYVVMQTIGLPTNELANKGKIAGGPYGVFASDNRAVKNGKLELRMTEIETTALLYIWKDSSWEKESEGVELDGEVLTAPVNKPATFVAVVDINGE